jgi:hypothetical protein
MTIKLERKTLYGEECPVVRISKTLEKEDAEIFLEAINDKEWPVNSLVPQLRNNGIKIAKDSIYAHRKNECKCNLVTNAN